MLPSATLFLDVCVQPDLGPDGSWPLLTAEEASHVRALFGLAAELHIRQGGIVCLHGDDGSMPAPSVPPHCREPASAGARPPGCVPRLPLRLCRADDDAPEERSAAVYVTSGCARAPDGERGWEAGFRFLIAGVRDAVVFGGGLEHGVDAVVRALLRRRIRTHVVLDAAGAADPERAQAVVGEWKRRGVDGATAATIDRLLRIG